MEKISWKSKVCAMIGIICMISSLAACGQVTGTCTLCGNTAPLYKLIVDVPDPKSPDLQHPKYTETVDIVCKECLDSSIEYIKQFAEYGLKSDYRIEKYTGK